MPLVWSHSIDGLDWNELSALYDAAPLGNKNPSGLKTAFSEDDPVRECGLQTARIFVSERRSIIKGKNS